MSSVARMTKFRTAGRWLVLPLALLLWGQWPLRDWVHAFASNANDAGQIVFAWYVALAISAATRGQTHLAAPVLLRKLPDFGRALALFVCIAPWAAFVLWNTLPQALLSVVHQEHFSEAMTPGYFLIRLAEVALCVLALRDAVVMLLQYRKLAQVDRLA